MSDDNWQATLDAIKRMHNATDCELVDILAGIPHELYCKIMRLHLNAHSDHNVELVDNSASIELRQLAVNYFRNKEQQ